MVFKHLLWDDENRGHVLAEGDDHPDREVYEEDVEDVVFGRIHRTLEMDNYVRGGEDRIDLLGKTTFDRILFVTVAPKPNDAARPVSARYATARESALYESTISAQRGN